MNEELIEKWNKNIRIIKGEEEDCVHCGTKWYVIHHKDGLCHECQAIGAPGRSILRRREKWRNFFRDTFLLIIITGSIAFMIISIIG